MRLNSSKGGLIGILIIILVLSTLLVLSLRREEIGSPVYLAKNEHPALFQSTESRGKTMIFNFGVICEEPFKELEIRFANMFMSPEPDFVDPDFVPNASDPLTIMESRKDIQMIKESLGNVTIPFDSIEVETVAGNVTNKKTYRGIVYDFSRTLGLFVEPSILDQIPEVFAVLMSEDGEVIYFTGIPDFFYEREENIKYLSIHYNQNETTYEEKTDLLIDVTPVGQAPRIGSLIFEDTGKDDQVLFQMNVESRLRTLPETIEQVPFRRFIVHYIRAYANGKLEVSEFNMIPMEATGWNV